ncbi:Bug family tripartite tricarboxylate transporter substrate binding protein [Arthrobacter crystallopoietes]|uniref:Bug family tripartite tricarboxylate transporter substrate binding protein n=1 Tax=Crystallibacter crystallopoietes TaxID=37928 RepID=UPI0011110953|nr:tripartite tricarboxylate transporter substrate-binding protein [Arthrobacter crystallopoietes]
MASPKPQPGDSTAASGRSRKRTVGLTVYGVLAALVIAGAVFTSSRSAADAELRSKLTLIAPAGAGGGWDTFAREQQQALRSNGIVNSVQVVNVPGAAGTIGLGQFSTMHGQSSTLMATGTVMLGGIQLNDSPVGMDDVRPLARLADDYDAIVVPADSPFNSIDDLIAEWKKNPRGFPFTGGSIGSIDHLVMAQLAMEAGIDASQTTYIPNTSGGEALQTVFSDTAKAAISGYNEFADQIEAGRVKVLAISAPQRLEGIDVPTLLEEGYDVQMSNWRGMVAAPGTSDEDFEELLSIVTEMSQTEEWEDALARNQWDNTFMVGEDFEEFIAVEEKEVAEILEGLDL